MRTPKPFDTTTLAELVKKARPEYEYDGDVMNTDPDRVRMLKYAVSQLGEADRIILIAYCEINSERTLASLLGVSKSTIHNKLAEIRQQMQSIIWQSIYFGSL